MAKRTYRASGTTVLCYMPDKEYPEVITAMKGGPKMIFRSKCKDQPQEICDELGNIIGYRSSKRNLRIIVTSQFVM